MTVGRVTGNERQVKRHIEEETNAGKGDKKVEKCAGLGWKLDENAALLRKFAGKGARFGKKLYSFMPKLSSFGAKRSINGKGSSSFGQFLSKDGPLSARKTRG